MHSSGYVLVLDERLSVISLCTASFASIVAQAKSLNLLFLRRSLNNSVAQINLNNSRNRLLRSYPNSEFFYYMRGWRCKLMNILARRAAARAYRTIKTPKDLLAFEVDGICFGDLIYDALLAEGYATLDAIDHRTLRRLQQLFFYRYCIKDIIKRYDIRSSVFAHVVGLASGVFCRYILKNNIEVFHRLGSNQTVIKKYRRFEDFGVYSGKLEYKYFKLMMEKDNGTITKIIENHLERRFNHELNDRDASFAYDHTKRTFSDKNSFCDEYNLDRTKPVAFVMLHAFNDFPHSHFSKSMLFQDYYRWFLYTLKIAQTVKTVNWIFKEHPSAKYYPHKDVNLEEVFEPVKADHICFLRSNDDFNARSVRYLANVLITCMGTAGLENATQGVPCVLGGPSLYSNFGFTIEPESVSAYERCLENINQISKLNQQQVKAAKIVAYFNFCLYNDAVNNCFFPNFDVADLKEWNDEFEEQLWRRAAEQFRNKEQTEAMLAQTKEISQFVLDDSWTQYFDMRQLKAEGVL